MSRNCGCTGVELPGTSTLTEVEIKKLIEEVKKLMKDTQAQILCQNGKINETMVYIKNYLSLALQSLLDSMEASGEIDTIILNAITNYGNKLDEMREYFNTKSFEMDFERVFRHMAVCMANREDGTAKNQTTGFSQGLCDTGDTLIFAEVCNWKYNNSAHFVEVYKDTWEIKREFDLANVGHASAVAYNKCTNELFVLPFYYNTNGEATYTNDLMIYNYTSLAFKKKVVLSTHLGCVTVDNQTNKMYGADNGTVYQILSNYQLVKLFDYPSTDTVQGIALYDNYVYILKFSSTYIAKYDLTGNLIAYTPIQRYYGFNYTGEPEGIAIDEDGNLYFSTCSYHSYTYYYCNQIFKTNVKSNIRVTESRSGSTQSSIAIFVGNPTSNNPNGTSANPFGTLCEAILCLNSPAAKNMGIVRITLQKDCPEETLYWRGGNILVYGGYTIGQYNLTDCHFYINATKVVNKADMLLKHNTYIARSTGVIYSITSTQDYGECNINLEYSQVRIVNATLNGTPTEGRIKTNGGEVYSTITAVSEAMYGNGQSSQRIPKAFTSATPLTITKEQIYQLSRVFSNMELFCSLTENDKTYYSGTNIKLIGPNMDDIANGSMDKLISVDFATQDGAYMITCTLNYNNGSFLLKDFTSYKVTADGITVGTKQFTVVSMTLN